MAAPRMLQYDAGHPLYGVAFSNSPSHPFRTALTTLSPSPNNKLILVDLANQPSSSEHHHQHHHHHQSSNSYHPSNGASAASGSGSGSGSSQPELRQIASINLAFPATKVGWEPKEALHGIGYDDGSRGELLATSGDSLRIFEVTKEWDMQGAASRGGFVGKNGWEGPSGEPGYHLRNRSVLTNSKTPHMSLPPITSFSWNPKSPNSIVTCSVDTTATLWDINTSQALTQLIAHDRAVYDLSWLPDSSDIFVSVGADGSLRAFDLRQLEHSTILYESSKETPLARIAFSKKEQHMMACFGLDDSKILVLDMRSPGQPVAELVGHQAPLGAIAWGSPGVGSRSEPTGGGWIASCGDDSQLLLYDLTEPLPESRPPSTQPQNTRSSSTNDPYSLSPPMTPNSQPQSQSQSRSQSQNRSTPSGSETVERLPVKGWTAENEINNLAFNEKGDWVGCVSGGRLNVLQM